MTTSEVLVSFSGNRMSVRPKKQMEDIRKWITNTPSTSASGPRVSCQREDWPGSTPTPFMEWHRNRHFHTHATEEVLIAGFGTDACTRFRCKYLTFDIRNDCFKGGKYAKNVQEACFTILDTLRDVLTRAEIKISLLELMRVGPKFMIVDMITSALSKHLSQSERSAQQQRSAIDQQHWTLGCELLVTRHLNIQRVNSQSTSMCTQKKRHHCLDVIQRA